jgi:hypothetical protein
VKEGEIGERKRKREIKIYKREKNRLVIDSER